MIDVGKKVIFGDLYDIPSKNGVSRPSRTRGSGFKMINMGELFANDRIYDIEMELVPLNMTEQKKYEIKKNDLLFARQSIVAEGAGKCSIVLEVGENVTCFESHIIRVRLNEDLGNPLFYYYFFQSELGKGYLSSIRQQGVQAGIRGSELKLLKLPYFNINIQNKIAGIISTYDDLIENNLKRIKLLEEQAQHYFQKSYGEISSIEGSKDAYLNEIVSFDIGGGWGEEYESDEFCKLAYVIRGTDMPNVQIGLLDKVPLRWHKKNNLKSRKLENGDIIFEVSGGSSIASVGRNMIILDELLNQFDNPVICASFCKLIRLRDKDYALFLACFLNYIHRVGITETFEKRSASNIINYNWSAFLKFQKVCYPTKSKIQEFNQVIKPIYSAIYNLGNQNQLLKEARDLLLPRLLSGMIDVNKIGVGSTNHKVIEHLNMVTEEGVTYNK